MLFSFLFFLIRYFPHLHFQCYAFFLILLILTIKIWALPVYLLLLLIHWIEQHNFIWNFFLVSCLFLHGNSCPCPLTGDLYNGCKVMSSYCWLEPFHPSIILAALLLCVISPPSLPPPLPLSLSLSHWMHKYIWWGYLCLIFRNEKKHKQKINITSVSFELIYKPYIFSIDIFFYHQIRLKELFRLRRAINRNSENSLFM
jgi:hypothetical protein